MSLEKSVEALAPMRPVSPRNGQRKPDSRGEANDNAGREFSKMLQGQGLRAEAARSQASAQADEAAAASLQRRREGRAESDPADADAASAEADGREADGPPAAKALKLQLGAEDLNPATSTLRFAGLNEADAGAGTAAEGWAELGKARHAAGQASRRARADAAADAAQGAEAKTEPPGSGEANRFQAALQAAGLGIQAVDEASQREARQSATERLAVPVAQSEGNLPSLGAVAEAPARPPEASAAEAQAPVRAELPVPPESPAFPASLGLQLSTWVRDGIEHAVLELHPRELGPIEVRIAVENGAARIELSADVASTRAALADALPQLAEQLGGAGLSLSGGSVSDQNAPSDRDQAAAQARSAAIGGSAAGRGGPEGSDQAALPRSPPAASRRGLLDIYA